MAFGILGRKMLLTQRPLHHLEVFVGEIDPGGSTGAEPYAHGDSEELFVVLSGTVRLELGDGIHELETGDSIGYSELDTAPHLERGRRRRRGDVGDQPAELLGHVLGGLSNRGRTKMGEERDPLEQRLTREGLLKLAAAAGGASLLAGRVGSAAAAFERLGAESGLVEALMGPGTATTAASRCSRST